MNLSPGNLTRTDVSLLASYEKRLAAQRTSERFACLIDNLIYIDAPAEKDGSRKIRRKNSVLLSRHLQIPPSILCI